MKNIIVATAAVAAFSVAVSAQAKSPLPKTPTSSAPAATPTTPAATSIYFTWPIAATEWKAGQNEVKWNSTCTFAPNATFPIQLFELLPGAQYQTAVPGVGPIGNWTCTALAKSKEASANVIVPATVRTGKYSIFVNTDGVSADKQSFSATFSILGANPVTSSTRPATSTSTPSKTATLPTPSQTGAASSVKAGSAMALAVIAAIGSLVL
ncbi:hypothetical protein DFQ26_008361 [Actinomortierella ambigua]|nr:hypothetical protein DFQ26_008361 [Actinomortierella ambigua]